MTRNPFEVLRVPPDSADDQILYSLQNPYPGAVQTDLIAADEALWFEDENRRRAERALFELDTFHAPDYQKPVEDYTDPWKWLGRIVPEPMLETLGPSLLDHLIRHFREIVFSDEGNASAASEELFEYTLNNMRNPWLLHDLSLLAQRLLCDVLNEHQSYGDDQALGDIIYNNILLWSCCEMLLVEKGLLANWAREKGEDVLPRHFSRKAELFGAWALNGANFPDDGTLLTIASAWFTVQRLYSFGYGEPEHPFHININNHIGSALQRRQQRKFNQGAEHECLSGNYRDSLALPVELLCKHKMSHLPIVGKLVEDCAKWIGEYEKAEEDQQAEEAAVTAAMVCRSALVLKPPDDMWPSISACHEKIMSVAFRLYGRWKESRSRDLYLKIKNIANAVDDTAFLHTSDGVLTPPILRGLIADEN